MRSVRSETKMVEKTITQQFLVCDWCPAEVECGAGFSDYPESWRRLELYEPTNDCRAIDPSRRCDLCPECSVRAVNEMTSKRLIGRPFQYPVVMPVVMSDEAP